MTPERICEAFASIARRIHEDYGPECELKAARCDPDEVYGYDGPTGPLYAHVLWVCMRGPELVREGRVEKACRWLGFAQGVLWARGGATVARLKDMNRSEAP